MRRRKSECCECYCPPRHRKYDYPMRWDDMEDDPPLRGSRGFGGREFGRRGFRESPFFRRESPFFRRESPFFGLPFFFW